MKGRVYLIPTVLAPDAEHTLSPQILNAVKECNSFYTESERTARRGLKKIWKEMVIDDYSWFSIKELSPETEQQFRTDLKEGKTLGVLSEAGCPGVADPGQKLASIAQQVGATLIPLTGPSSILLALMASGMNGQQFRFWGYLPIEAAERIKSIRNLEAESKGQDCTQIFIETPYRNNALLESLVKTLAPDTLLCIAADITAPEEFIRTKTIREWKTELPQLHKRPAIFLIYRPSIK